MCKSSLATTYWPALFIFGYSNYDRSNTSLWFWFTFPWRLRILNTFSHVFFHLVGYMLIFFWEILIYIYCSFFNQVYFCYWGFFLSFLYLQNIKLLSDILFEKYFLMFYGLSLHSDDWLVVTPIKIWPFVSRTEMRDYGNVEVISIIQTLLWIS